MQAEFYNKDTSFVDFVWHSIQCYKFNIVELYTYLNMYTSYIITNRFNDTQGDILRPIREAFRALKICLHFSNFVYTNE